MRSTEPRMFPAGSDDIKSEAPDEGVRLAVVVRRHVGAGYPARNFTAEVYMRFLARVSGSPIRVTRDLTMMMCPDRPGDPGWMRSHVWKYEDGMGANGERAVERKVENMVKLFNEAGGTPDRVGYEVIRDRMDWLSVDYDVSEGSGWDAERRWTRTDSP